MEILTNINGTQVPLTLTEDEIKPIRDNTVRLFMEVIYKDMIDHWCQVNAEELFETEVDDVVSGMFDYAPLGNATMQDLASGIVSGVFYDTADSKCLEVVKNRAQYYRYTIEYRGEIEVVVKARNEREAKEYLENMSHYDLSEWVDYSDTEFEVRPYPEEIGTEAPAYEEVIDAMED